MAPFFFQHTLCDILIIPKIEVVMPVPFRAVAENNCGDTVVALSHNKVCKAGYLINYSFFGYLEHMPEQVGIATEVPYCIKTAPPDCISCLPAPE